MSRQTHTKKKPQCRTDFALFSELDLLTHKGALPPQGVAILSTKPVTLNIPLETVSGDPSLYPGGVHTFNQMSASVKASAWLLRFCRDHRRLRKRVLAQLCKPGKLHRWLLQRDESAGQRKLRHQLQSSHRLRYEHQHQSPGGASHSNF